MYVYLCRIKFICIRSRRCGEYISVCLFVCDGVVQVLMDILKFGSGLGTCFRCREEVGGRGNMRSIYYWGEGYFTLR